MRKLLLLLAVTPLFANAQVTVGGYVTDSITRTPLGNATVQLVSRTSSSFLRTAETDSAGVFELRDVPAGEYSIGFLHPLLDSLGIEAPLKTVRVEQREVLVYLSVPSAASIRRMICGATKIANESSLIIGTVRSAGSGASISGANVVAEWYDLILGRQGMSRKLQRASSMTNDTGWFALCNVPALGTTAITAVSGSDSTDVIELVIPAEGFVRRDIFVGARKASNNPRISGVVTTVLGGQPLQGAVVSIAGSAEARTNEKGEWTITDAPAGTRMLEVRALGYYPARKRVDVIGNAPLVRTSLSTFKAVLDTVRIVASRVDPDRLGFMQRRKQGFGKFITAEDMFRHPVINTTDAFKRVPGVYVEGKVLMRGAFENRCEAAVYIDGQYMRDMNVEDIDDWVPPKNVAAIEVYTDAVPPQFNPGIYGCGSIVIWRK